MNSQPCSQKLFGFTVSLGRHHQTQDSKPKPFELRWLVGNHSPNYIYHGSFTSMQLPWEGSATPRLYEHHACYITMQLPWEGIATPRLHEHCASFKYCSSNSWFQGHTQKCGKAGLHTCPIQQMQLAACMCFLAHSIPELSLRTARGHCQT
jgi:hypothetical protein